MRRIRHKYLLLVMILVLVLTNTSIAAELFIPQVDVASFTLSNGLRVFVMEDHSVPLVEFGIMYKVGSIDERPGFTGISHFLEHTMFLGTSNLAKGRIDELINSIGGNYNAVTSFDYTYYYFEVPASKLELVMAIESDRMGNLLIDPVDINREREVIKQERRGSIESNPVNIGLEQIQAVAFANSSLSHQVIGWGEDLDRISDADLVAHYHNFYAPNNAIVVVAGDVTVGEVRELVEKYFGHYQPKDVFRRISVAEYNRGEVVLEIPAYTNIPITLMLYRIPAGNHPDLLGISVFLNILVNNASSRVKQELQNNLQLIIETGAFPYEIRVPGFALVYTVPITVEFIPYVQATFDALIDQIINEGITQEELDAVKKATLKNLIFLQRDAASLVRSIALGALQYDNPNLFYEQMEVLNSLTVEDIQAIAAKYFTSDNRVVGNIVPIY